MGDYIIVNGGSTAGSATAANQVLEIAAIENSNAVPYEVPISGTVAGVSGTDETTLALGVADQWFLLRSSHFIRTAGTGATYQIHMSGVTGWTAGDIDERFTGTTTPVATETHEMYLSGVPIKADAAGNIYVQWGFDAGADNDASWAFIFERVRGA